MRRAAISVATRTLPFRAFVAAVERTASDDPRRLSVLTYHRIGEDGDELDPALKSATPDAFAGQMEYLADTGRVVALDDVLEARRDGGRVSPRAVLLTFDDAYRDFAETAWPTLRALGLPATLFVPTGYPGTSEMFWWDRLHRALAQTAEVELHTPDGRLALRTPRDRAAAMGRLRTLVSSLDAEAAAAFVDRVEADLGAPAPLQTVCDWETLRRLAQEGVSLAPHTRTHARLDRVDRDRARAEVEGSIDDLRREIGDVPPVFAYPAGGSTADTADVLADAGVEVAFTTNRGRNDLADADWLRLRRTNVGRRATVPLIRLQLAAPPRSAGAPAAVDFVVHRAASIRLVGATARDIAAVGAQLGVRPQTALGGSAITIRYEARRAAEHPPRLLGGGEAVFTTEDFLILRGARKRAVRVRIPFESIGRRLELVAEPGTGPIPFLVPLLNLTLLGRGVLALHACAFEFEGRGVVATGWSKSGKTELLLGMAERGARYVGDEWVYVDVERGDVIGLPEPVRVWDWHLRAAPSYRRALARRERVRLGALRAAALAARPLPARFGALVRRHRGLDVEPARLFGGNIRSHPVSFDRLIFVETHEADDVFTHTVDALEVARRTAYSLRHERRDLLAAYDAFCFAFPERRSRLLDEAHEREQLLVERAFVGKPAVGLRAPYPVPIAAAADALVRALEER